VIEVVSEVVHRISNECDQYDTYYVRTRIKDNKGRERSKRATIKRVTLADRNLGMNPNWKQGVTVCDVACCDTMTQ
jgi:hypothetical protein